MTLGNMNDAVRLEDVIVRRETDKAILCCIPDLDGEDVWIPKSQVCDESEVYSLRSTADGPGTLVIPRWLAEQKGLS